MISYKKKKIEDVISLNYTLKNKGRYWLCVEHDSLVVDTQRQMFFWNSKGISGDVFKWVTDILGQPLSYLDSLDIPETSHTQLPASSYKALNQGLGEFYYKNLDEYSIKWWNNRGVFDLKKWGVGFCKDFSGLGPTSTIPYYEKGKLVSIKHRLHTQKDKLRYIAEDEGLGVWVYNADVINNERILIVEGEIKAMVCEEMLEFPTIGIPSVNILPERYLPKINECKEVFICLDPDINIEEIAWVKHIKSKKIIKNLPDKIDDLLVSSREWTRRIKRLMR